MVCRSSIFLILKAIKKNIDLKSKNIYTSSKKLAKEQKLPIAKLKKKKKKIEEEEEEEEEERKKKKKKEKKKKKKELRSINQFYK